jgi:hypothetical protein
MKRIVMSIVFSTLLLIGAGVVAHAADCCDGSACCNGTACCRR